MDTVESYWTASTEDPVHPALEGHLDAGVAVVGGGITGLTAALELQKAGHAVVLLEAHAIGRGATGSTTGKLTAGQGLVYSRLEQDRGMEDAARYAASQTAALEHVADLVATHDIACDFERTTNYVFAERDEEIELLEREAGAALNAGLDVDLDRELDLPFPCLAAIALDGQAQFHARKYLIGLARAFEGLGGRIFQDSRVLSFDTNGRTAVVLANGHVAADHVVLATHVPTTLRGAFFARVHAKTAYGVAGPLADGALEGMWINVGSPTRSLRTTPLADGGRLLIGVGEGHRVGREDSTAKRYAALESYVRDHFPATEIAYRWSTQDQYPVDGLPFIGRLGDDEIYVATGFAGWGLTNGTLAGMLIADAISGRDNDWASLFDPSRSTLVRAPRSLVSENVRVGKELIGGKLQSRPESFDEVVPGAGAIVRVDGRKVAASRDDDGVLTIVGAACTHLGCDVAWNDAERTWDCPCHGSRFRPDGEVIEGPAVEPLASIELITAATTG